MEFIGWKAEPFRTEALWGLLMVLGLRGVKGFVREGCRTNVGPEIAFFGLERETREGEGDDTG